MIFLRELEDPLIVEKECQFAKLLLMLVDSDKNYALLQRIIFALHPPLHMDGFLRQKWSKDAQAEKRRAEHTYANNFKNIIELAYRGVIVSPLIETPVIPDSILIYCDGPKLTYIINALSYEHKRKYRIQSTFEGFGESCSKGGLMPFITRKAQIVIPGTGDRSFAGIQDHELGIGMPPLRQLIPKLDENLTPGFKYMREVIDKKLKEMKGE
jgi:hypothetical protein